MFESQQPSSSFLLTQAVHLFSYLHRQPNGRQHFFSDVSWRKLLAMKAVQAVNSNLFCFSSPVTHVFAVVVNGVERIFICIWAARIGALIQCILVAVAAATARVLRAVGGGIHVCHANGALLVSSTWTLLCFHRWNFLGGRATAEVEGNQ